MSTQPLSLTPLILFNDNNTYLWTQVVDGYDYFQSPPVVKYVTDLTITLSLYLGRNIANPVSTPGSLVTEFGSSGNITMTYQSNGIYLVLVPAFTGVSPGPYVLVSDAPTSPSGYQLHRERVVSLQTGQ